MLHINQSNYFIVPIKVDQRAGQLSLPHLGMTKTEKIELKHKTDEQISPVNGLEPETDVDSTNPVWRWTFDSAAGETRTLDLFITSPMFCHEVEEAS